VPDILYGKGSYRRDNGNFTSLNLVNMFPEAAPTVEQGVAILSRPGLALYDSIGSTGPIYALFQRPGLFDGDLFVVSGSTLYRNGVSLGAISGSGPVSIAHSSVELVITRGATAHSYNGTNLAAISFPDSANVTAVAYLGGRFLFARAGSQRFYWSELSDGRTVEALSYTAADSAPDYILDIKAVGDNLFVLGTESLEVYYLTTSITSPYIRINQRSRNRGVVDSGCMVEFDNALHFIGNDFVVYRMAEVPNRISNHGLEERIAASTSWRLFSFLYQGHAFLCVQVDDGTWVFDPAGGPDWPEFRSYGLPNFVGRCAETLDDGTVIFGSAADNSILQFSDGWTDVGYPLERRFTGAFPIKGGVVPVDALELECNVGSTTASTGPGADPQIEVRASRDGGHTFGHYRVAALGAQGERRARPRWRRWGYFDAPGAVFDFRLTDPSPLRVSAVLVNEPAAGRARNGA
jgi:hypothetical protein